MMNKRIRSMIDEIFAEMKMTAENLALRDELMANAQARYEDSVAQGKSQEEAFMEVASSLGDVHALLEQMNEETPENAGKEEPEAQAEPAAEAAKETEPKEQEAPKAEPQGGEVNLGDAINKAFAALGSWGQSLIPQAKKIAQKVDDASGGMLEDLGKAAQKTVGEAQKAAGEVIDRLSGDKGELVFGLGGKNKKQPEGRTPEQLRGDAATLRADAEIKQAVGDEETAREMPAQAYALETQADALEQAMAMEAAQQEAKEETEETEESPFSPEAQEPAAEAEEVSYENHRENLKAKAAQLRARMQELRAQANEKMTAGETDEADELLAQACGAESEALAAEQELEQGPFCGADGEIDEDALSRAVDEMAKEAESMVKDAQDAAKKTVSDAQKLAQDAAKFAGDAVNQLGESVKNAFGGGCAVDGEAAFPVAGLRTVDVKLDSDDVFIGLTDGQEILVKWHCEQEGGEPQVSLDGHKLTIRRRNPDVFKTFFSVFQKAGGQISVLIPRGYAADMTVSTTSGDVRLSGLDVDNVKVGTTSGDIRLEPDAGAHAKNITVNTVSGDVTVSACAQSIAVNGVSGDQFISCEAGKVDVSCVSGRVHVEGACEDWEVDSVSGDVELLCTVVPARRVKASTMSANVHLALPGDIRGFVAQVSGMNAKINNEFGPNRYGTCALPISMDTMSGELLITRL